MTAYLYAQQRQAVLDEAGTWLGTPWEHNAAVKGGGVDCGRFPLNVYVNCGLVASEAVDDYPIDWALHRDEERYLQMLGRYCSPVGKPLPGDIVVFRFGRSYSHGAIVRDYPLIIHALRGEKAGVVYGHALQGQLKCRERLFYSPVGWAHAVRAHTKYLAKPHHITPPATPHAKSSVRLPP